MLADYEVLFAGQQTDISSVHDENEQGDGVELLEARLRGGGGGKGEPEVFDGVGFRVGKPTLTKTVDDTARASAAAELDHGRLGAACN